MHQCQCPAAQDNVVAHRGFIEMLAGFHARHAVNGFDRQDAQRLVDFLDRWLADHIGRIDVQIKPYAKLL
jgi:hemerythrin